MDEPDITISPQSTTIFLNSYARFTCGASDFDDIYWCINGTSTNKLDSRQDITITDTTVDGKSMLTIHGKTKYNGSLVQCKAVSVGVAVVQSENVTLYIQGEGVLYLVTLQHDIRHSMQAAVHVLCQQPSFSVINIMYLCSAVNGRYTRTSRRSKDQEWQSVSLRLLDCSLLSGCH